MDSTSDQHLLREYAAGKVETAFAELVRRHLDFVYSAALRIVSDPHLAEDVAQGVFLALANAPQLAGRKVLAGWLHRTTRNLAANTVRAEVRRRTYENEAAAMNELLRPESDGLWEQIAPHLDAALGELGDSERDALLLRYFQKKSARDIGRELGVSEEAAQKRVNRAVDRLREYLSRHGITAGAGGLAVQLTANAVQSAPAGLAGAICSSAVPALLTGVAAKTTLVTMNSINIKALAAVAVGAMLAGTTVHLVQKSDANRLREENQSLLTQQANLGKERDDAVAALSAKDAELQRAHGEQTELLRLRGEVGLLRNQTNELEKLRRQNLKLQTALSKAASASPASETDSDTDPQRQIAIGKMNDAKLLVLGMLLYANEHQDQYPAELARGTNYLTNSQYQLTGTNQFELVLQGPLKNVSSPATTIAVREKEATYVNGVRIKAYGFADGHAEIKREPPEGFETWEAQHIAAAPPAGQ